MIGCNTDEDITRLTSKNNSVLLNNFVPKHKIPDFVTIISIITVNFSINISHYQLPDNLETLILSNNIITCLEGLQKMSKLAFLYIDDTKIDNIEQQFVFIPKNLKYLNAGNIGLTTLIPLLHLTNLEGMCIAANKIVDYELLLIPNFPKLVDLECDINGNVYILYKRPNIYIYDGGDFSVHPLEHKKLQIYMQEQYIELLYKYLKLTTYSTHIEFVDQIMTLKQFSNFIQFKPIEGMTLFETLQMVYDRLYYAPHGPNFDEGLKFCKN